MVGFAACSRPFFFPYMCHTHGLNGKIMPSQQKEIKMIQFIQGRPKEEPKNDFFFFFRTYMGWAFARQPSHS